MELCVKPSGDSAVVVVFGNEICPQIYEKIAGFCGRLDKAGLDFVTEYVPTYCSVTVQYNPLKIASEQLATELVKLAKNEMTLDNTAHKIVEIPVCYGGDFGPDLAFVAQHSGMTEQEVIKRHSERLYPVYMMGFTPGFPYLGGMDSRIATPRLQSPRVAIPAGSVGIAGEQTGIYPIQSPGGWQLIGKTPIKLFDLQAGAPFLVKAGDQIRFVPITAQQFHVMAGGAEQC